MAADTGTCRILRSSSFDPWFNLAQEQRLFQTMAGDERILLFWRNDPVVVIGRYQNPWRECRQALMALDGVSLARRQSGGGAVYHDRGNLCITFMGGRAHFDRKANISLVAEALRVLGYPVTANERNDLLLEGRKISGSAYRETSTKAFHHATLLLDADLSRLSAYLAPKATFTAVKGIASVRSTVTNLKSARPEIDLAQVEPAIARAFAKACGLAGDQAVVNMLPSPSTHTDVELAEQEALYKSWEWRFGGSPDFTARIEAEGESPASLEIEVIKGLVSDCILMIKVDGEDFKHTEIESCNGIRFDGVTIANLLERAARSAAQRQDPRRVAVFRKLAEEALAL